MSELTIREQARLPFRRCVSLVLNGISFRLFRASVTVSIVALAVAFLATIAAETMIAGSVGRSVGDLTRPRQLFLYWTSHLAAPLDAATVVERLRPLLPGEARARELAAWGGCDGATLNLLIDLARQEARLVAYFDGLEEGVRRPLVGRRRGREILAGMREPGVWNAVTRALEEGSILPPATAAELQAFLEAWARTEPSRAAIADGHRRAVGQAAGFLGGRPLLEALAAGGPELAAQLGKAGFHPAPQELEAVGEGARFTLRVQRIDRLLGNSRLRQRLLSRLELNDLKEVTADRFYRLLASRTGPEWLLDQLRELGEDAGMTAGEVRQTARTRLEQDRLAQVEAAVAATGARAGGWHGLSPRVLALVGVSLLVCVVGIVNAMLMSVTERFTEIATMKCLGATDGVVMANFMLEAGFQGVVGGCIGGVLGVLLGVLRASLVFGSLALQHVPVAELAAMFVAIMAAGVVLSVVAAVYPAWMAARLSPMEAMRVE